jgi:ribonuclease T1
MKRNNYLHFFKHLLIYTLLVFMGCKQEQRPLQVEKPGSPTSKEVEVNNKNKAVPGYVLEVLQYVKAKEEAPAGYVGGRNFQNREKQLPLKTPAGKNIRYREWDVYPKEQGRNRGAERLVTGSDQSAWYTKDHYRSFLRVE